MPSFQGPVETFLFDLIVKNQRSDLQMEEGYIGENVTPDQK